MFKGMGERTASTVKFSVCTKLYFVNLTSMGCAESLCSASRTTTGGVSVMWILSRAELYETALGNCRKTDGRRTLVEDAVIKLAK